MDGERSVLESPAASVLGLVVEVTVARMRAGDDGFIGGFGEFEATGNQSC